MLESNTYSEGSGTNVCSVLLERLFLEFQNPWNIMIKHRHVQRRGRRSQMTVSYTDPVISMDLLRTVLQPNFNEDILAVFRKYMKFFEKAASNVKENVGEEVQADQLIREVCRNCLEQAKQLFSDGEKTTSRPMFEPPVKVAALTFTGQSSAKKEQKKRNCCCRRCRGNPGQSTFLLPQSSQPIRNTEYLVQVRWELKESKNVDCPVFSENLRARHMEDDSSQRGSPVPRKRKGRPPGPVISSDRPVSFGNPPKPKTSEPIKREGPKWDPSRLNEKTTFVLGSRANKALGMGGTRGRIYIKHADLFKYAADAQDKHWLAEKQHMRATGGKMAYLLIEEDVQDLARSEDYRDCPELRLDELKPFMVPPWMIEKMQKAMEAQRSEKE